MDYTQLFESIYNESRSKRFYYVGRYYNGVWQIKSGHFDELEKAQADVRASKARNPSMSYKIFKEDDPEVLSYLKVKPIEGKRVNQ